MTLGKEPITGTIDFGRTKAGGRERWKEVPLFNWRVRRRMYYPFEDAKLNHPINVLKMNGNNRPI